MDTATLSSKGQLVIPRKIRLALHLQPGDKDPTTDEQTVRKVLSLDTAMSLPGSARR
jgi:AbrB family looped-hinge helix DNA binding protein